MKEEKKLNMEKVKQVTLIVIGLILLGVGFVNYEPENSQDTQIAIIENEDMIGDVELVSAEVLEEDENFSSAIVENTDGLTEETAKEDDYFETTKIERDAMYSKMLSAYQEMLDNENLVETQKAIAVQEITKINNNQNAIMIAENLIKNKGFEKVVILVSGEAINVVVKSAFINDEDISKIQNIIEREFEVSLEKVNISNRN